MGGEGPSDPRPLWLSIRGRVYDVSRGEKFYGKEGPYHVFVGRDATRAFCTGCLEPECLIPGLEGLSPKQIREADRWAEFFEFHDRYSFVGTLTSATEDMDALVELALEAEAVGEFSPPEVPST